MPEALIDAENLFSPLYRTKGVDTADLYFPAPTTPRDVHDLCITLCTLADALVGPGDPRLVYSKPNDRGMRMAEPHLLGLGWEIVHVPDDRDEADRVIRARLEASDWGVAPYVLGSADAENVVDPTVRRAIRERREGSLLRIRIVLPPDARSMMSSFHVGRRREALGGSAVLLNKAHFRRLAREAADNTRTAFRCECEPRGRLASIPAVPLPPDEVWLDRARALPEMIPQPAALPVDGWTPTEAVDWAERVEEAALAAGIGEARALADRLAAELPHALRLVSGSTSSPTQWRQVCQIALLVPEVRRARSGELAQEHADLAYPWALATFVA